MTSNQNSESCSKETIWTCDDEFLAREAYIREHPELNVILTMFKSEVLRVKPDNIIDYGARVFFAPKNRPTLESALSMKLR
mmetsp:Transcript_4001/g.6222  ORF Transcript_4001/g.6222 Transcript_4001/m.6222 type:complete len:81 (-) Transcript_4001:240-482(-)